MSEPRKPQFVECSPCGEIWKYATIPMAADLYLKALKSLVCPNCGETRMLVMCKTDGPEAVTGPRDGRAIEPTVRGRKGKGASKR